MKFCTNCQSMRQEEGGVLRRTARAGRWMCKECAERKTESIYKSKTKGATPESLARLKAALAGREKA